MRFLLTAFFLFLSGLLMAQSPSDLNKIGAEAGERKEYNEAIEYFNKAASINNKELARYYHNKAWLYETQGDNEKALAFYEKANVLNPEQVETIERLGYQQYRRGNYAKAIELGEKAAAMNPAVENLKSWLPDAYRKNLESAAAIRVKEDEKKKQEELGPSIAEETKKKEPPKPPKVAGISVDTGLRYGRDVTGGRPYYIPSPGKLMNVPLCITFWFKPASSLYIRTVVENPYWGAAVDPIVSQQEFLEGLFSLGAFSVGAGLWFTHYDGDKEFGQEEQLNDFKVGLLLKYEDDKSSTLIRLYPRLLPRDTKKYSDGKTLDCGLYELTFKNYFQKKMGYYTRMAQYDFLLFDHDVPVSHYWGFFEIALGLSMDYDSLAGAVSGSFFVEYAKRINLRKLNEDKPYAKMNGQNFLGFDASHDPRYFSGYRSRSNIVRIGATEMLTDATYIYQGFSLEIVDRHEDHQEVLLKLGVGVNL